MRSLICLGFCYLSILVSSASAITLSEPQTGLTVEAPKGFRLTIKSGGIYSLTNGRIYARFFLARSPFSLTGTGDSLIKLSKAKVKRRTLKGGTLRYDATLRNKPVVFVLKPLGSFISVVTFGGSSAKRKKGVVSARATAPISARDIALLQNALNTLRGGTTLPLRVSIPMKNFTAPDGGSTAIVPDLPGWRFSGGGGVIAGSNLSQGAIELGVPQVVSIPGFPGASPPFANPLPPDQAIAVVFPQYVSLTAGLQIQVTGIREIGGTAGWLGPNILSALYAIKFVLNGQTWSGLMVSGSFDIGTSLGWGWYHSYIAVPDNGPGGVGAALINTWASWDNSGASQQRLAQALQTLRSIRVSGFPIDPEVFERTANAWDEYIRG